MILAREKLKLQSNYQKELQWGCFSIVNNSRSKRNENRIRVIKIFDSCGFLNDELIIIFCLFLMGSCAYNAPMIILKDKSLLHKLFLSNMIQLKPHL